MLQFSTPIKKFSSQGEKTGWTYIDVPSETAQQLLPGNKKSFRVRALLDGHQFGGLALLPMGGGNFILAINSTMRRKIKKAVGAMLEVALEVDNQKTEPPAELLECLHDEPKALEAFNRLPPSHKNYYTKWINSAKGAETKARRIAATIRTLQNGQLFNEAVKADRNVRNQQGL